MSEKKHSSQRRIESSRANGARSQGPVTPEGKARSSRNSLKHGLTAARHILLTHESTEDFDEFHTDTVDHFQPRTAWEQRQVHLMANLEWNLNRALSIESAAIQHAMDEHLDRLIEENGGIHQTMAMWQSLKSEIGAWPSPALSLVHRYRHSLGHHYHAAFLRLRSSIIEPLPAAASHVEADSSQPVIDCPAALPPAQTQVSENGTGFVSQTSANTRKAARRIPRAA